MTVVIALGGNALLDGGRGGDGAAGEDGGGGDVTDRGTGRYEAKRRVLAETAEHVVAAIEAGHEVVLTHGNGPQVGALLLQQAAAPDTPQAPLDVKVAQTQAGIGYGLQRALDNALDGQRDFLTLVTQVVVDPDDPAFDDPTKPVGPWYTEAEARERPFETARVGDGEAPCRRVVPSPAPQRVVEAREIRDLVARGNHVVCGGGGGVPVVDDDGLRGVEAVVDKDHTAALLGEEIGADRLVVLTDVDGAYLDYGGPDERRIEATDPERLREHAAAGAFGVGSMRPKVLACCEFVEATGGEAVVTTPDRLPAALEGSAGTRVQPAGAD